MEARGSGATERRTADGRWLARRPLPAAAGASRFAGAHARVGFPVELLAPASPAAHDRALAALRGLRRDAHQRLLDQALLEGRPCLVLEHAGGASLAEVLAGQRRLAPHRARRVALDVAAALAEMHALGRVHGDVRPENVLVSEFPAGEPRAKLRGHGGGTAPGPWAAPELGGGRRTPATPASDVFSLGVLVHSATSGRWPRPTERTLPPLGSVVPVPGALADLVAWATRPEPDLRPASALELLEALEDLDAAELARFDVGPAAPRTAPPPAHPRRAVEDEGTETISLLTGTAPSIWVALGEAAAARPEVAAALVEIGRRHPLRRVAEGDRAAVAEGVRAGAVEAPWVVVFDDMAVLCEDPLLAELGAHGETSRMLLSTHADFGLAHHAVNACGLDQHVSLPAAPQDVAGAVDRLVHRALGIRRHYDGLRLALRDAQEDLAALGGPGAPGAAMPRAPR